uniref:Reverse transcriptase zinc-binding domain-containing protein n=1 Tax=Quercus lobata TaxID=97700 RepID=A0A7N2KW83_QUELO
MIASLEEATVDMLIDEDTRQWNPELVDGIFAPEESALIKKIPLARCETEDSLYWPLTQEDNYTSKSSYRFLKEEAEVRPLADSESQEKDLWKKIWALKVPNKVKNHMWRACRNSLPTKTNLVRRTIIANDTCDRCHGAAEVIHTLWECPEIDVVWTDATLWDFHFNSEFADFKHLVAWLVSHGKNSRCLPCLHGRFGINATR